MVLTKDKYIIIGIFLLLISLVMLVGFNLNRGGNIIENFQSLSVNSTDLAVDSDANLFQALINNENYVEKIGELENEVHVYNKKMLEPVINSLHDNHNQINKLTQDKLEIRKYMDKNPPNIIRTLKSNYNGQLLTVDPYDLNSYQVQINDKCLTVYDDNKYLLEKCNTKGSRSDSQKFSTHRIRDIYNANTIMGRKPNKQVEYPYNIFKSELTNQCLTVDDEGVTVQKCLPDNEKQHFKISDEPLLCKEL